MNYPKLRQSEHGTPFRFLENIGEVAYWQIRDHVCTCSPNACQGNENSLPFGAVQECSFSEWEKHREYLLRHHSLRPFKEHYLPCICRSKNGKEIVTRPFFFYAVAGILDTSEIAGIYVRSDEFHNKENHCPLYVEHGGFVCNHAILWPKNTLWDFSQKNIAFSSPSRKTAFRPFLAHFCLAF